MAGRLDDFLQQAKAARSRAAETSGEFRGQWLQVAEMWELLAREYSRVRDQPRDDGNVP